MILDMTITINTKAYNADAATSPNSVPYNGPLQTISIKDRLELARTPPKANVTYSGNARARAKMTRTNTLTGAKTTSADAIVDLNVSVPVGSSDANVDTLLDDFAAFAGSATFKSLVKKQLLSY